MLAHTSFKVIMYENIITFRIIYLAHITLQSKLYPTLIGQILRYVFWSVIILLFEQNHICWQLSPSSKPTFFQIFFQLAQDQDKATQRSV